MPNFRGTTRLVAGWACVAGLMAVAGCTTGSAAVEADDRPVVLATFTVIADMARVIGDPEVRVESLTKVGAEVHGYEPTPDDLRRAAEADLMLANGLGLEAWFEALVAPLDIPTSLLTDRIDPLPIDPREPDGPVDPAAWMSPLLGATYVDAIVEELTDLHPAGAEAFRGRAERYQAELRALHEETVDRLANLPAERRLLATCEGAFGYLARDTGLTEAYLWPVNAEREGTPRQVARVILAVRESEVPAVFCESTVSATAQQQVARETGVRFGGVLYVDSLSGPSGPVPTYLDLLRHDVDVIVAGLGGDQ